ncbi:monofunctional biosynthetic peptidoglycan transglycosylase [Donghicola sp. C2-DW-16]|uniref:Biosynthetic peptidoglycan transglycosylase n=1 Tax=Donghicola mangrovi TaxID=2729614 RepID=A0A850Q768_9RHOB|nr:monofunctional biosynthetic peptidoglycan transglycosylase [Donghicola mangrovi]NVO22209.1 monofunctional biosynthetic peptidoglycan transglycosylase [Donghicola mangrovi]NVO26200.1 monofunctional biosynthetic peptidoglycan transglycosylase [Donghicola mangrovi]
MAKSSKKTTRKKKSTRSTAGWFRVDRRTWVRRVIFGVVGLFVLAILLPSFLPVPQGLYMRSEARRLGEIQRVWTPMEDIAPVMARSVVAAEDANFCTHWGFDMSAIRVAIEDGGTRGASTLSQQVVKNVYLWQDRSWVRKALEALLTPLVEAAWSKRRIVEVYLNVAEFDEGIFGVEAAARNYFGTTPAELTPREAALLAALLPDPKERDAANPSKFVSRRATQIADGAATIARDGRAACFED